MIVNTATFERPYRSQLGVVQLAIGLFIALACILFWFRSASAATCTFASNDGTQANAWTTAENWSCAHVPTSGDDVVIPTATTTNISAQPASDVENITINGTGILNITIATAHIAATSSVSIADAGQFNVLTGSASTTALTIAAGGAFTVTTGAASATTIGNSGTLTIGTGTVTSTATVTNGVTGTIAFSGAGTFDLRANFTNTGTFTSNAGTVRLIGGAAQSLAGVVYNNLLSAKSGGTVTFAASSTVDGTATMSGADTWTVNTSGIQFQNAFTVPAGSTLTVGAGSATSSGVLTNAGTITITTGTLQLADNFTSAGTFTPGTGTVRLIGGAAQSLAGIVYNNFRSDKSAGVATFAASSTVVGTLITTTAGTLSASSTGGFLVVGAVTIGAGTTLAIGDGTTTAASTISNSGTLAINTGTVTSTGALTNAATGVIIFTGAGRLELVNDFTNSGTFTAGAGTVKLTGSGARALGAATYNNVASDRSSGTTTLAGTSTIGGALTMSGGGVITSGANNLTVTGASTVGGTASVISTTGNLTFTGAVTSTGTIGSTSGNMLFSTSLMNNGTLSIGSGTATSTGVATSTGTLLGGSGKFVLKSGESISGTFTPGTGTVEYSQASPTSVQALTYYGLAFTGGTTYTMTANTTSTGPTTILNGNTLAINAGVVYTGVGLFTNTGLITEGAAASIVHAAESIQFTDTNGVVATTCTTACSLYVTIQDSDRNLNGAAADTMTVPMTTNAAAGSDSETLTLTETGLATGIFRNATAFPAVASNAVSVGSNRIEVVANGVGTATYTDSQDATDATSSAATLTYSSTVVVVNGVGGGSGGGGGMAPYTTTYQVSGPSSQATQQTLLANLTSVGVSVNALVKLPDDGNPATQEDSAVYYIGADGKRHAFPNDKTYFTWYPDFSSVTIVSGASLASIPLGPNVHYKPGTKMVKFQTDPKVYAVELNGKLRWIRTEEIATALYGADWNTKIDDLSDAFFANYSFGADIAQASDFNPATQSASATTISTDLIK
jgi:hypothetical protein